MSSLPRLAPGARALVVGAGGLLGRAVVRKAQLQDLDVHGARVRWSDLERSIEDLSAAVDVLLARPGAGTAPGAPDDAPWAIVWCAGAGVTASTEESFARELAVMEAFVEGLLTRPREVMERCVLFFASSAGGLYAGAPSPPFTEHDEPAPLAPYGHAKLRAEAAFSRLAESGARVVLGRITNLYGPGQNLSKPQGLISQLCLAQHRLRPASIYVSLDTLRDYIYVDDCAELVLDAVARASALLPDSEPVAKILGSQGAVSIAEILGTLRIIHKRKPQAILAASPLGKAQARDLRFRSVVWPELDARSLTPLPVGIATTSEDIARSLRLEGPPN